MCFYSFLVLSVLQPLWLWDVALVNVLWSPIRPVRYFVFLHLLLLLRSDSGEFEWKCQIAPGIDVSIWAVPQRLRWDAFRRCACIPTGDTRGDWRNRELESYNPIEAEPCVDCYLKAEVGQSFTSASLGTVFPQTPCMWVSHTRKNWTKCIWPSSCDRSIIENASWKRIALLMSNHTRVIPLSLKPKVT